MKRKDHIDDLIDFRGAAGALASHQEKPLTKGALRSLFLIRSVI